MTDQFLLDYLDLLSFLLSGLTADGTIAAEMAVMFNEWYKPDCCLEFPKGGSQAMVNALVRSPSLTPSPSDHSLCRCRAIEKNGGKVLTRSHVEEIQITNNRATGVRLRNGTQIEATKAVVSNASVWDTVKLIAPENLPPDLQQREESTPLNPSFMHLHVGFDATGATHRVRSHDGLSCRFGCGSASHHCQLMASASGLRAERRAGFDSFSCGSLLCASWKTLLAFLPPCNRTILPLGRHQQK